ncbi:MAG: LysM peptidoglycan-binding domain-containing protein [Treponema sp.]|jgi:membrane-bound lytic murein transglycosylase D|nr:LysM peptidoglycan-binding domain-containing protein [Treponema sp.]
MSFIKLLFKLCLIFHVFNAFAEGLETEEPTFAETPFPRPLRTSLPKTPPLLIEKVDFFRPNITGFDEPLTQEYIAYYSTKTSLKRLTAIMENAEPYMAFIRQRIEEKNLPWELLYLPVIESEFIGSSRSKSGASGLWQFMRNSVKPYMQITEWVDERLDFWKATEGALSKLSENYRVLGDWALALAAYNMGLGGVNRVIQQTGVKDYWELCRRKRLKTETIHYVPKLLAVSYILTNHRKFGLEMNWERAPEWTRVNVGKSVDLGLLANASGVALSKLQKANQELIFNVTPPDKDYQLKVHVSDAEQISAVLEQTDIQLIKHYIHVIESGDTLSALARRYGASVELIEQANPGVKPRSLKLGQRILIPALKGTVIPTNNEKTTLDTQFNAEYVVKKGETLWSIAAKYRVSVEALANANNMGLNDTLSIGKVLKTPN